MPSTGQRHDAVDHATPGRSKQNQGEDHTDGLGPIRQRSVVQVVRTGPHVGENQRPEVHHRQAIGVNRTTGLLRNEVVHHAQEAGSQEEADGIVTIPPLNHRVLHTGVSGVGLGEGHRQSSAVTEVQQGDSNDEGTEKPVGNIDVRNFADCDSAEEHDRVGHPNQGDQNVDRPLQFCVLLAAGNPQGQRNSSQNDDQLPTPEGERNQRTAPQTGMTGALHNPVGRSEESTAAKSENNCIGMQRTQANQSAARDRYSVPATPTAQR